MNGENRQLLTDELAEFERSTVEVHEFWKLPIILAESMEYILIQQRKGKTEKITTCN